MECVILFRTQGGKVDFFRDDKDMNEIAVFSDHDAAADFALNNHFCQALPFQIVVLDEL